jgi:hypothetical protein
MGTDFEEEQSRRGLQAIAEAVRSEASSCQGDSLALLALLRMLESLHREIHDGFFQPSLPVSRQALYSLLKDIETSGGWPYIPRLRLRSLLDKFLEEHHNPSPDGLLSSPSIEPNPETQN